MIFVVFDPSPLTMCINCSFFFTYIWLNRSVIKDVNPPSSAQLGGSLYHAPKLHPGPCRHTDRQTHTYRQTSVTTIHFASSTTHAKCNNGTTNVTTFENSRPYLPYQISSEFFYSARNARIASAVLATAIRSVRPSVRPSVCHTPVLCQNDGT